MAETTPSRANAIAVANLEEALARPEPMCLAMLEVHLPNDPDTATTTADDDIESQVMAEAYRRLRDTLRDYDELSRLGSNRFILVMRTLADASILAGRMRSLDEIMTRPYVIGGSTVEPETGTADPEGLNNSDNTVDVEVFLGAVVRVPQETSAQLVDRVDQAVILARSAVDGGPVLL